MVFLIVILTGGVYAWDLWKPSEELACAQPISYAIGTFDRRFGVSYRDFLSSIAEAEQIWEEPHGGELFTYLPESGDLTINLIYDYRQEITNTLSDINEVVEENESTYDALHSAFRQMKSRYDADEILYEGLVKVFNKKNDAYGELVDLWNSGLRTSKEQFKELEDRKLELQSDLSKLKLLEGAINGQAREINVTVERLNRLARSLNLDVEKFNTIGALRGETFTGGLHSIEGDSETIDVFEFRNKEKLVRVLAHELGHALGLEHVDDRGAIMYHLNEGSTKTLTGADKAQLRELCSGS